MAPITMQIDAEKKTHLRPNLSLIGAVSLGGVSLSRVSNTPSLFGEASKARNGTSYLQRPKELAHIDDRSCHRQE